ncbi:MAG: class I SAM-dependent methyltransferase [Bryobacteraceae bacterium]|nr:class I SAM-dependent methyltransferase [Bryobacteraceae bacterium]
MSRHSIAAYSAADRIARYDADMDLMHPNRHTMVRVALDFLPFAADDVFTAVDLGCGSGFFTAHFLERFPRARAIAIDGATGMIELARTRLGELASRVDFRVADFRSLSAAIPGQGIAQAVFSSYALHHLTADEKGSVASQARQLLTPGSWFLNADLIVAPSPAIEQRIQALRVEGILRRADGRDPRFADAASVRRFLDELEAEDKDQPLTVEQDMRIIRDSGFTNAAILWLEHREAVVAARR